MIVINSKEDILALKEGFDIEFKKAIGSGIPKIYQSWSKYNWTKPLLYEKNEHHPQILLELRTINLVNEKTINELKDIFGKKFEELNEQEIIILATAYIEEAVNHKRILKLLDIHPSDVSNILKQLTQRGFLEKIGVGKGSSYIIRKDTRGIIDVTRGVTDISNGNRFYKKEDIPPKILSIIEELTNPIKNKQRVKTEVMKSIIIEICQYGYFSPELLSKILNRSKDRIKDYISELVAQNRLHQYFSSPNSPKQVYTSNKKKGKNG